MNGFAIVPGGAEGFILDVRFYNVTCLVKDNLLGSQLIIAGSGVHRYIFPSNNHTAAGCGAFGVIAYAVGVIAYCGVNIMKRRADNVGKRAAAHGSRGQAVVYGPYAIVIGIAGVK